jgi:hypothetical protein
MDHRPAKDEMAALFSATDLLNRQANQVRIEVQPEGSNSFAVLLDPAPIQAADYLDHSKALEPDLEIIRQALKRPYTRMEGDYTRPFEQPIPNFVMMRTLAQTLADRTKCHLMLNEPDKALADLALLHDICRVLESKPTGKSMTLVAAMINVAINGLYVSTIADGLRSHAWREPELVAIQGQLTEIDLLPDVREALREERVGGVTTMEKTPRADLLKLIQYVSGTPSKWEKIKDPFYLYLRFAPRGWIYRNMIVHGVTLEAIDDFSDAASGLVSPGKCRAAEDKIRELHDMRSPYTFLEAIFLPNFTKSIQTTAHNQTLVNEALVACALERYRLEKADYPEALDALSPRYLEKMPHDIIGGQPLHYRRVSGGEFLLYSIGWNEKDDGGQLVFDEHGNPDAKRGDWVWPPD